MYEFKLHPILALPLFDQASEIANTHTHTHMHVIVNRMMRIDAKNKDHLRKPHSFLTSSLSNRIKIFENRNQTRHKSIIARTQGCAGLTVQQPLVIRLSSVHHIAENKNFHFTISPLSQCLKFTRESGGGRERENDTPRPINLLSSRLFTVTIISDSFVLRSVCVCVCVLPLFFPVQTETNEGEKY